MLLAVNAWLMLIFASGDPAALAVENGPIENLEAVTVAIAFLLFMTAIPARPTEGKALAIGFSLLTLTFFFRELDIRRFDAPTWLAIALSGEVRDPIFVGLFGLFAIYLLRIRRAWRGIAAYLISRPAMPIYGAAGFLFLGAAFEQNLLPHGGGSFWEESAEINGYLSLVLAALRLRGTLGASAIGDVEAPRNDP